VSRSVEIREHFEAVEDRMEAAFASSRKLEFPASVTEALRNSSEILSSSDVEFCILILDFGPGI
jgi:hypothetical protein